MTDIISRRSALKVMTAAASSLALPAWAVAEQEKVSKKTLVYKAVGKDELKADLYQTPGDAVRPVILWIHGGALIAGYREAENPPGIREALARAGYRVVSIDYRLAPETKLPAILEDAQDAYRWIREKGPRLFAADADRVAVMGESAGGYLTQTAGFRVEPRPKALVSFWGYGDIAGAWLSRPDPYYRRLGLVSEKEARALVGKSSFVASRRDTNVSPYILYCRQNGLWPKEVTGHDPDAEPKAYDAFCPIRNVSAKYPPTLLIHGTKDTDVPYDQSVRMDKELARHGVEHGLVTIPDGGHGLGGAKPSLIADVQGKVFAFLRKHLQA